MVERGLKLWQRRKNGDHVNPLKVSFLGKPGVDTGALKKEFLSSELHSFCICVALEYNVVEQFK